MEENLNEAHITKTLNAVSKSSNSSEPLVNGEVDINLTSSASVKKPDENDKPANDEDRLRCPSESCWRYDSGADCSLCRIKTAKY